MICYPQYAPPTATRWEYLRENRMWGEEEKLNKLGSDGWELVAMTSDGTFLFKRPAAP